MSKTLKRPMFRMGGDTNSGIMSGFERKKFDPGGLGMDVTRPVPGGYSPGVSDAPRQILFPADPKEVQSMWYIITAVYAPQIPGCIGRSQNGLSKIKKRMAISYIS